MTRVSPLSRALLACAVLLLLAPGAARATPPEDDDTEAVTEPAEGPLVHEESHRVEGRVEGGLVRLTVQRTWRNRTGDFLEWETELRLPPGATVHGFALASRGSWTEGVLLEASEAERRYEAVRAPGSAAPRLVARLTHGTRGAWLSLWNLPPHAPVSVRYDVRLRPAWEPGQGAFPYPLPSEGTPEVRPSLTLTPPFAGASVRVEETKTPWNEPGLEVSWRERPLSGLEARAGVTPWKEGALGLLQLRTGKLSEAPSRARVVFVLDASHSVGPAGITRQLDLAERILQFLPDASVEGVVFRRSAERLFGHFLPTSEWRAAVKALPAARLAPGNGSHLDEGLRLAQRVLAENTGPARVIALTDGQLRHAFAPVAAAPSTSAPDAAVHLVWLSPPPERKDAALSGAPVREACGTRLHAQEPLEALVRPVRLEGLLLEDARGERLLSLPPLGEARGLQRWLTRPQAIPGPWTLRGERWGCAFSAPVGVDAALSADLGRTAFAWPASSDARTPEAPPPGAGEHFARTGSWLSPTHAFLALTPGAGPSSARTRTAGGVHGGVSGGVVGGSISCGLGPSRPREDRPAREAALRLLLPPLWAPCAGGDRAPRLQVRLETTGDELVDVAVTGADSEAQATCVREATWALRLPPRFVDAGPDTFTLTPRGD